MKIAIFTDSFYPSINWVVVSTLCFVKQLSKLWHEIQIYCPLLKWIKNLNIDNVEIIPLRWIPALFYPDFKFTTFSTPKVLSKIKKFKPDVIHFHTQFVIWFKGIMIWKLFKIPIIGTYHTNISDEWYLKNIRMENIEFIKKYAHKYNNLYYENADLVLAPSIDSKNELINNWISEEKIKVLFNPLPLEEKSEKIEFLKDIHWDIILYVGRIAKEKNIEEAINIFTSTIVDRPNYKLILVWDWPERFKLEKYVKDKWIEKSIIFLGMIKHIDLINSDIFEKSKVFLTASLSETFWITLIEALYFWVPVVWFRKWWLKDLIINDYNWLLFEVWDKIWIVNWLKEIIDNKEKHLKYSNNSKEFVKKFDANKLTSELISYYESAINNKKTENTSFKL